MIGDDVYVSNSKMPLIFEQFLFNEFLSVFVEHSACKSLCCICDNSNAIPRCESGDASSNPRNESMPRENIFFFIL